MMVNGSKERSKVMVNSFKLMVKYSQVLISVKNHTVKDKKPGLMDLFISVILLMEIFKVKAKKQNRMVTFSMVTFLMEKNMVMVK